MARTVHEYKNGRWTTRVEWTRAERITNALIITAIIGAALSAFAYFFVYPPLDAWGRKPIAECGRWHRILAPGEVVYDWKLQEFNGDGWTTIRRLSTYDEASMHCTRLENAQREGGHL